jgi:DNA-binding response OmpR family regulator
MHVLLVDDEEELASALAERLTMRGIATDWVTSGEDALRRAASETYDLAVLDLKMPKIGGLELKALLQAECPDLKFIFVTGYGSEKEFKAVAGQSGEANFLVKPVDIQLLIERIQALLKGSGGEA